jgi:hypothetical protein
VSERELLAQEGHRARTDYLFPAEPSAIKNKGIDAFWSWLAISSTIPLLSHVAAATKDFLVPAVLDDKGMATRVMRLDVLIPIPGKRFLNVGA